MSLIICDECGYTKGYEWTEDRTEYKEVNPGREHFIKLNEYKLQDHTFVVIGCPECGNKIMEKLL